MKAEKKITIKVKSKAERRIMGDPEVEMISEWNIKRILSAVLVLLIFIIIPAYYLTHLDDNETVKSLKNSPQKNESNIKQQDSVNEILPEQVVDQVSSKEVTVADPIVLISPAKPAEQENKGEESEIVATKEVKQQKAPNKTSEIEYVNKHITHARLAKWVQNREPHGQVDLPLLVDNTKAEGFYYFTEVNNMKGSTIFHEWLREGKSIYKRKFIIRGKRGRMSTSKLFTFRSTGQWQVRMITDQGEVLHKIDFSVENK